MSEERLNDNREQKIMDAVKTHRDWFEENSTLLKQKTDRKDLKWLFEKLENALKTAEQVIEERLNPSWEWSRTWILHVFHFISEFRHTARYRIGVESVSELPTPTKWALPYER